MRHIALSSNLYIRWVVFRRRAFERSKVQLTRATIQSEPVGIAQVSKVWIFLYVMHIPYRVGLRENNATLETKNLKKKQMNNLVLVGICQ